MDSVNRGYPKINKKMVVSSLGEEKLIFDPKKEKIHILNKTAALIWEAADGKHSPEKIAARLAASFKVGNKKAKEDVFSLLKKLQREGLIS